MPRDDGKRLPGVEDQLFFTAFWNLPRRVQKRTVSLETILESDVEGPSSRLTSTPDELPTFPTIHNHLFLHESFRQKS